MQRLGRAAHDVEQGLPDLVRAAIDDKHQRRRNQRLRAQAGAPVSGAGLRQRSVMHSVTSQRACLPSRSGQHSILRLIRGQNGGPTTSCTCGRLLLQSGQSTAPRTLHFRADAIGAAGRACWSVDSLVGSYTTVAGCTQPCTADSGVTSYSWRTVCPPPTLHHATRHCQKLLTGKLR
jgi:hypothetical protein